MTITPFELALAVMIAAILGINIVLVAAICEILKQLDRIGRR